MTNKEIKFLRKGGHELLEETRDSGIVPKKDRVGTTYLYLLKNPFPKVARDFVKQERKATNWISVKDKLPNKTTRCLAYTSKKVCINAIFTYMSSATYYIVSENWIFDGVNDEVEENITHWMPLPKPPED